MSALRAIVPAQILRRWDALAAAQIFAISPVIAEELENERHLRSIAEDCADMWQRISEITQDGGQVGLTVDGRVVDVTAGAPQ